MAIRYSNNDQDKPFEPKRVCGGLMIDITDLPPRYGYSLLSMCEDLHMCCTGGMESPFDWVLWTYNVIRDRVNNWQCGPDWMSHYDEHVKQLCQAVMSEYEAGGHAASLEEDITCYNRNLNEYPEYITEDYDGCAY